MKLGLNKEGELECGMGHCDCAWRIEAQRGKVRKKNADTEPQATQCPLLMCLDFILQTRDPLEEMTQKMI